MIISVDELRLHVETNLTNEQLEAKLLALEIAIRKQTNNNFQNRNFRFMCDIKNGVLERSAAFIKVGDTVEITDCNFNKGIYVIKEKTNSTIVLDKELYDEDAVLVTKIVYPEDVKMDAIEIMRWKLKNENQNYNPEAEKEVQSESISRHSVTYAKDTTESDLDNDFGVPRKYA